MVLPQAANMNTDNVNQYLVAMARDARQGQLLKQQRQVEDDRRKFEVLNSVNPAALSEKFDSEIVNSSFGAMRSNIKEYLKKNPNSFDLQGFVQDEVSKIAAWNSRVKAVRQRVDDGMKNFGYKGFEKSSVYASAIDAALYKTDENGRKVLKSPEEINVDDDYIGNAVKSNARGLLNSNEAYSIFDDEIKSAHLNPIVEDRVVKDQNGLVRSTNKSKVTYPNYMEWDDAKGEADIRGAFLKDEKGNVMKDEKGRPVKYIAEDIYARYQQDPAADAVMTEQATKALEMQGHDPNNAYNLEIAKRAWLTKYYEDRAGIKRAEENSKQIVTVHNYGQGAVPEEQKPYHPSTRIEGIERGLPEFLGEEITVDGKTGSDVTEQFAGYPLSKDMLDRPQYPTSVLYKDGKFSYKLGNKWYENISTKVFNDRLISNSNVPDLTNKIDPKIYRKLPEGSKKPSKKTIEGF